MLLVHQAGSVKVGEVVRYTITYTPSLDRILPSPDHLYVRIKNSSAVPLRAAYLHGPYTLHVCSYPSTFNPNQKLEAPKRDGIPEFESNLKAGGQWHVKLHIPEDIRETGEKANIKRNIDGSARKCTWIVEVASQILFSNTAAVHYELMVSRDERSLDMGFASVAGKGHGEPGNIKDFQQRDKLGDGHATQPRSVYSKAIDLMAEDTATLWNKPPLPQWGDDKTDFPTDLMNGEQGNEQDGPKRKRKPKKIHLVVLTHGLHSNVGADMLYLKESIDGAAKEARIAARARRRAHRKRDDTRPTPMPHSKEDDATGSTGSRDVNSTAPLSGGQEDIADDEHKELEEDEDDEQIIVRGYWGNACRTDRGVQYLGKRLAKFILSTTYPDQPFLPASKSKSFVGAFGVKAKDANKYGAPIHEGSTIHRKDSKEQLPYTFTGISFIGHSLGGLVQIYAAAYIHKHSPGFFDQIKPRSFIAMATPLLGLSNENPLYVKFALDFGLVGRTGQDLGLTWRAPTIARNGWSAMIAGFGGNGQQPKLDEKQKDPGAKPLLRILPTGPAHHVLKMFENRTLYSNIVNDGIVPLRTSSLMFLDWRSLEKVDSAQRQNGLIGTMAAFGWAELTGASSSTSHRPPTASTVGSQKSHPGDDLRDDSPAPARPPRIETDMPQSEATTNNGQDELTPSSPAPNQFLTGHPPDDRARSSDGRLQSSPEQEEPTRSYTLPNNPLTDFINLFRPGPGKAHPSHPKRMTKKIAKTYHRAQTVKQGETEPDDPAAEVQSDDAKPSRPRVSRGDTLEHDPSRMPPPKTSIFDAASDILNPPLPAQSWLLDPTKRERTIFHDRIYHPEDIPPPPTRRPRMSRSFSNSSALSTSPQQDAIDPLDDGSGMRVEEKIARAYHADMSWRKVLVRLEPDAHNNMIVRRIFANAHGWDVVKHVCDTHFAPTYAAETRDEEEGGIDRALALHKPVTKDAEEVKGQTSMEPPAPPRDRTMSENAEARDEVADLHKPIAATDNMSSGTGSSKAASKMRHQDSVEWSDSAFDDSDDGDDEEEEYIGPFETFQRFWQGSPKPEKQQPIRQWPSRVQPEVTHQLTNEPATLDTHRGLGVAEPPLTPTPTHPTVDADTIEPLMAGDAQPEFLADLESVGSPGGTTDIGLRKPPVAHVDGSSADGVSEHAGVTEQVARLSMSPKSESK